MSYVVEDVNGCTKKLVFTFENVDLSEQVNAALKEKQKTANLKGFRKGKAPLGMIQKIYGAEVENDALYKFISKEFFAAVQTEGIRPVGYPSFDNTKYESGKNVSFEAVVETFPEVEIKDISKLSFKKESSEVSEDDIKKVKENYLASKAEMRPLEGTAAENGHTVVLNFQGVKEDGERPENMKGEEYMLELGSNTFIPGFEEGLVGVKAGDKKNLELTFPAEYHDESLKNAKVTFETEVLEVKEKVLPELTDELAKEFGFESAEDFNTKNKERLVYQKEREVKEKLHQEILAKLIEENSFDVPQALIAQQGESIKKDLGANLQQQGFTEDMLKEYFAKWAGDVDEKAAFQVKSGLILDKLATEYGVEAQESDLDAKYEEMVQYSGLSLDEVKNYYGSNEQVKQNLMYAIREEKTFEKILEKVTLK